MHYNFKLINSIVNMLFHKNNGTSLGNNIINSLFHKNNGTGLGKNRKTGTSPSSNILNSPFQTNNLTGFRDTYSSSSIMDTCELTPNKPPLLSSSLGLIPQHMPLDKIGSSPCCQRPHLRNLERLKSFLFGKSAASQKEQELPDSAEKIAEKVTNYATKNQQDLNTLVLPQYNQQQLSWFKKTGFKISRIIGKSSLESLAYANKLTADHLIALIDVGTDFSNQFTSTTKEGKLNDLQVAQYIKAMTPLIEIYYDYAINLIDKYKNKLSILAKILKNSPDNNLAEKNVALLKKTFPPTILASDLAGSQDVQQFTEMYSSLDCLDFADKQGNQKELTRKFKYIKEVFANSFDRKNNLLEGNEINFCRKEDYGVYIVPVLYELNMIMTNIQRIDQAQDPDIAEGCAPMIESHLSHLKLLLPM